ncbi:MAG: TIGR02099 family protein [Proteobacteria bacterium]|nr:TIGR02099 family protein [Pseudomonadota bacterium]
MKPLYRLYRRSLSIFWTAATIVLVLLAMLAGLAELLLPYSDKYQVEIEAKLSEFAGQPVHFDSIKGSWDVTGPQFMLSRLAIYPASGDDSEPELLINRARVKFSLLNYLLPNRPFTRFEIVGAELELFRDREGVLKISGFHSETPMAFSEILKLLSSVEQLHLSDTRLVVVDEISGFRDSLTASSAEIQYRDDLFLASWQAVLGDVDEKSGFLRGNNKLGETSGQLSLRLDQSKPQSLNVWAKSHITKPGQLLTILPEEWRNTASGELDVEAWLEWQVGQPLQVQGSLAAAKLRWKMQSDDQLTRLDELSMDWRFHFKDKQHWSLWLADLNAMTDGHNKLDGSVTLMLNPDEKTGVYLQTGKIDLGFSQSLLSPLMRKLGLANPLNGDVEGNLKHLLLATDENGSISWLETTAENLRVSASDDLPPIGPFNLTAEFTEGSGSIQLHAQEFEVNWGQVFSSSQLWSELDCHLDISGNSKTSWQIQTQYCELNNKDAALGLQLGLLIPNTEGQAARVDAQVIIHQLQAASLKHYWPDKVMKKKGVAWLKSAFPKGEIRNGQIQLVGELKRFPFRQGGGIFSGRLPAHDMSLVFHPDWPILEHTEAVVELDKMRLFVNGSSLQTDGIIIEKASSVVDMTGRLKITIDFRKKTDSSVLVNYIHTSPLEEIMDLGLDAFTISGPATTSGHLVFYLDGRKDWFDVNGKVEFEDAMLELPDWEIALEKINGSLLWSEHGITAENIKTSLKGAGGTLVLRAGPKKANGQVLQASLSLDCPLENLLPVWLADQFTFSQYLQGETKWDIGILIEQKRKDGSLPLSLEVHSNLEGLSISLPAPLQKSAAESWPTHIYLPIQGADRQLAIRMENRLGIKMLLDQSRSKAEAVQVLLGGEKVAEPRRGYFSLGGLTQEFDLDGWLAVLAGRSDSSETTTLQLGSLAFEARELGFLGAKITDTQLEIKQADAGYEAIFSGPAIAGRLRLPGDGRKALIADFEHLLLPVVEEFEASDSSTSLREFKPASLPPMHLYAREFAWGHLKLKETRIETHPLVNGLRFESLEGTFGSVHLNASGDWLETAQGQRTNFDVNITAESFDEILQVLDFSAGITGGQSIVSVEADWNGSPLDIDFSSLNGNMELSVMGGSLTAANPGAGRLLGLVSLQSLPRRLMLDFRDVFTEGFHFDSAKGYFEIENGVARTHDVKIKSPAADILITGSTNMITREYDQLVRVRPGVSSALPVIGAIAAGPGGAAAGLALQSIFKKALGEAAEAIYKITGSWDDPVITIIEKADKNTDKSDTDSSEPDRKNTP